MIKNIVILTLTLILSGVLFLDFTPAASVVAPEVKKTSDCGRPVKDGNCYIQTDSAGNKIRVCG